MFLNPKKYLLEIVVFICGAVVMVLELVGSRILAPFIGTSLVVWTSLIGIILGSLSLGYSLGGRLADKNPSFSRLSQIIFFSSLSILLIPLIKIPLFISLTPLGNLTYQAIISTLALFALPSFLLGMVSPYSAKLKLQNLTQAGGVIGNLYALSTLGSIIGTFLAGFYLISTFSLTQILLGLGVTLLILSLLLTKSLLNLFTFLIFFSLTFLVQEPSLSLSLDTQYNHVTIFDSQDERTKRPIKVFSLDNTYDSAMFLGSDELVFDYTRYYRIPKILNPNLKHVLMIGGAGYSVPKDYLASTRSQIDVVELDPKLTELAKEHFRLKEDPRLTIFHEDGRTFLNSNPRVYDAIFIDAFKNYSVPFQLTTKEVIQKMSDSLTPEGMVIVNLITSLEGQNSKFLASQYQTYQEIFPQIYIFAVSNPLDKSLVQNIILLASKQELNLSQKDPELEIFARHLQTPNFDPQPKILTDEFAPVDQYLINL